MTTKAPTSLIHWFSFSYSLTLFWSSLSLFFIQQPAQSDPCYLILKNEGTFVSLCIGWMRVNKQGRWREDGENGEDTGEVLLYYLQSLYYYTLADQRARFMKQLLLFSLTLCSHLLKCLSSSSISLSSSVLCSASSFVFIFPFHICSLLFHLLTALFRSLLPLVSPRFPSPCNHISPRWIIAPRTAQQMQVRITSLQREHCCLSQERPSKVKRNNSGSYNVWHIFKKHVTEAEAQIAEVICFTLGNFFHMASIKIRF